MYKNKILQIICVCWVGFGFAMINSDLPSEPTQTITVSVSMLSGATEKIKLPKCDVASSENCNNNECQDLGYFINFLTNCREVFNIPSDKIRILWGEQEITGLNCHKLPDGADLTLLVVQENPTHTFMASTHTSMASFYSFNFMPIFHKMPKVMGEKPKK